MSSYIIRNNTGIYSVYYENKCIYGRKLLDGDWSEAKTIAVNTKKEFSIMHSTKNCEPTILYQDMSGNVLLTNNDKQHKIVLRNTSETNTLLHINGIVTESGIRLFYNKTDSKENYITEQHLREDGSWSTPIILDSYIASEYMTKLVPINDNYILFYSKKVPEQQIGYREISNTNISEFKMLYATGYNIIDYSLALTSEEIHLTAVISTSRGNKLIYLKKDSSGISKSKTLFSGQVKNCHISIQNSKIIILFSTHIGNSQIASYDMGLTFRRIETSEQFCFNKSIFADYIKQVADNFVATELLTDYNYPYNIRFCPFIPSPKCNEIEQLKKEIARLKKVAKP